MHTYRKSAPGGRGSGAVPGTVAPCWRQSATEGMDFEEEVTSRAPVAQSRRKRSLSALCCSSGASSASQVQLWWRARAFLCGACVRVNGSFWIVLFFFSKRLLPVRKNVLKCSLLLSYCPCVFLGWFWKAQKTSGYWSSYQVFLRMRLTAYRRKASLEPC